jgi:hypothetical protein
MVDMASSESDEVKFGAEKVCAEGDDEGGKGPRDPLPLEWGIGIGVETRFTVDVAKRVYLASSITVTQFCTSSGVAACR